MSSDLAIKSSSVNSRVSNTLDTLNHHYELDDQLEASFRAGLIKISGYPIELAIEASSAISQAADLQHVFLEVKKYTQEKRSEIVKQMVIENEKKGISPEITQRFYSIIETIASRVLPFFEVRALAIDSLVGGVTSFASNNDTVQKLFQKIQENAQSLALKRHENIERLVIERQKRGFSPESTRQFYADLEKIALGSLLAFGTGIKPVSKIIFKKIQQFGKAIPEHLGVSPVLFLSTKWGTTPRPYRLEGSYYLRADTLIYTIKDTSMIPEKTLNLASASRHLQYLAQTLGAKRIKLVIPPHAKMDSVLAKKLGFPESIKGHSGFTFPVSTTPIDPSTLALKSLPMPKTFFNPKKDLLKLYDIKMIHPEDMEEISLRNVKKFEVKIHKRMHDVLDVNVRNVEVHKKGTLNFPRLKSELEEIARLNDVKTMRVIFFKEDISSREKAILINRGGFELSTRRHDSVAFEFPIAPKKTSLNTPTGFLKDDSGSVPVPAFLSNLLAKLPRKNGFLKRTFDFEKREFSEHEGYLYFQHILHQEESGKSLHVYVNTLAAKKAPTGLSRRGLLPRAYKTLQDFAEAKGAQNLYFQFHPDNKKLFQKVKNDFPVVGSARVEDFLGGNQPMGRGYLKHQLYPVFNIPLPKVGYPKSDFAINPTSNLLRKFLKDDSGSVPIPAFVSNLLAKFPRKEGFLEPTYGVGKKVIGEHDGYLYFHHILKREKSGKSLHVFVDNLTAKKAPAGLSNPKVSQRAYEMLQDFARSKKAERLYVQFLPSHKKLSQNFEKTNTPVARITVEDFLGGDRFSGAYSFPAKEYTVFNIPLPTSSPKIRSLLAKFLKNDSGSIPIGKKPSMSGKKMAKEFEKRKWVLVRKKDDHWIYKKGTETAVIPYHQTLAKGNASRLWKILEKDAHTSNKVLIATPLLAGVACNTKLSAVESELYAGLYQNRVFENLSISDWVDLSEQNVDSFLHPDSGRITQNSITNPEKTLPIEMTDVCLPITQPNLSCANLEIPVGKDLQLSSIVPITKPENSMLRVATTSGGVDSSLSVNPAKPKNSSIGIGTRLGEQSYVGALVSPSNLKATSLTGSTSIYGTTVGGTLNLRHPENSVISVSATVYGIPIGIEAPI